MYLHICSCLSQQPHTHVVIVLARPDLVDNPSWMDIGHGMLPRVPSAKAKVDAADEGYAVIDDDELLVMCLDVSDQIVGQNIG